MKGESEMNAVNLTGYISEHLNLRYTPNGNAVVSFNLAVKKPYKVEPGKQDADFFRIVAWGKLAENLVEYTKKGSLIAVNGSLKNNNYEKDGVRNYSVDVVADKIEYLVLDSKKDNSTTSSGNQSDVQSSEEEDYYYDDFPGDYDEFDDDLPF